MRNNHLIILFPLYQYTKNLNINSYRKEIAPLEKTSPSAVDFPTENLMQWD